MTTTSGTYAWNPTITDIVLDSYDRIQIRPAALTPDHLFSARRSINQILVRFANRGINLWAVDEQVVTLNAGQGEYNVPQNTVTMLETWIRSYQLTTPEDISPACSTTDGSAVVELTLPDNSLAADDWVSVPIYVSVGGIIIQGFYQVLAITGASTFTITADDLATATVVGGGAVPAYATVADSATVTVTLAGHGLVGGDTYTVHVSTTVGGLTLLGDYIVQSVPTVNTLTITAASAAGSTDTASENDGEMQIAPPAENVSPTDRILTPISRTDWAAIANKFQQMAVPTSYWFDRTDPPTVNIWGVPDSTQPQELHYYRMRQLQDADPTGTQTADVPYRFEEALCAELTYLLAMKWKPEVAKDMFEYSKIVWDEAMAEDRERVVLNLAPTVSEYFR